jgi:hypothetical protein
MSSLQMDRRVTTHKVCEVHFYIAQHDFIKSFRDLRDLRAAGILLGLPWLIEE